MSWHQSKNSRTVSQTFSPQTRAYTPTFILTWCELEGQAPPPLLQQRHPPRHRPRPELRCIFHCSRAGPTPSQGKHQLVREHLVVGKTRPCSPGSSQVVLDFRGQQKNRKSRARTSKCQRVWVKRKGRKIEKRKGGLEASLSREGLTAR